MTEEPKNNNKNIDYNDDFEEQQNLLGFFSLLLKVDKRINPHLYKKQRTEEKAGKK